MNAFVDPGASRTRGRTDDGAAPPLGSLATIIGTRVLPFLALWFVLLAGTGWLLGHPLTSAVSGEDGVNRYFVAHRSPGWNTVTNDVSHLANTGTIIISTIAACTIYWLIARRLRDVLPVAIAVVAQSMVFLLTTLLIDRPRPDVPKLDQSPPTSSFPSGHTGAGSALYFGLVMLCLRRFPSVGARVVTTIVFGLVPFAVATARLYRGMHHPTDVVFGLLNGLVCATIAVLALRPAPD